MTTKDFSLWLSQKVYKWDVSCHDEADAAMLLEHVRCLPPETLKVPKRPRKPKK